QERELGILQVGAAGGGQYGAVRETLRGLRAPEYRIGGPEALAALGPLARVTGLRPGILPGAMAAMQFGKAYGLTAQEATAQMATLALAAPTRVPDLAVSRAVQVQAERAGIPVLPPAGFAQAAAQLSTVG